MYTCFGETGLLQGTKLKSLSSFRFSSSPESLLVSSSALLDEKDSSQVLVFTLFLQSQVKP